MKMLYTEARRIKKKKNYQEKLTSKLISDFH